MKKWRKVTSVVLAAGMLTSVAAVGLSAAAAEAGVLKVASISDIQYSAAHTDSSYVDGDLLIGQSAAMLDAAIESISASDADIVVVTGDLTADGTQASHNYVAGQLAELETAGKQVYVIPGDKDVSESGVNTGAITKAQFAATYADFGYTEAGANVSGASYMVAPKAGFNLIMLDTVGADGMGAVPAADLAWAEAAAEAASGVTVAGVHFPSVSRGSVDRTLVGLIYTIAGLKDANGDVIYTGNVEDDIAALNNTSLKIADRTCFYYADMEQLYAAGIANVFSGHSLMNSVITETTLPEGAEEAVPTWTDYGTGALVSSGAAVRYTTIDSTGASTGTQVTNLGGQTLQDAALAAIEGNMDAFIADTVARAKVVLGRLFPIVQNVAGGFIDAIDLSSIIGIAQDPIRVGLKNLVNDVLSVLGNLSSYAVTDEFSDVIDDVVAGFRATVVGDNEGNTATVDEVIASMIAQQRLDNTQVSPLLQDLVAELKSDSETKPLTEAAIDDFASKVDADGFYAMMQKILDKELTLTIIGIPSSNSLRDILTGPVSFYLIASIDFWQMIDDMVTTNPDGTPVAPQYKPSALYRPLVNALILQPTSGAALKTAIADNSGAIVDLLLVWGIQYAI